MLNHVRGAELAQAGGGLTGGPADKGQLQLVRGFDIPRSVTNIHNASDRVDVA